LTFRSINPDFEIRTSIQENAWLFQKNAHDRRVLP
jgi:hypothetical protein